MKNETKSLVSLFSYTLISISICDRNCTSIPHLVMTSWTDEVDGYDFTSTLCCEKETIEMENKNIAKTTVNGVTISIIFIFIFFNWLFPWLHVQPGGGGIRE